MMKVLMVIALTDPGLYTKSAVLPSNIVVIDSLGYGQDSKIMFQEREYYTERQLVNRVIELINDDKLGGFYGYATHLVVNNEKTLQRIKAHWKRKIKILGSGKIERSNGKGKL